MKRNTALFGASLVAGVAAASGLIMTSGTSSAAPGDTFGVNWANTQNSVGSGGAWKTGAYGDAGSFSGSAAAGKGTFQLSAFDGAPIVTVSVACDGANPVTTVAGGGATGKHAAGTTASLAAFSGEANVIGTVTFGSKKLAGHSVGAYIDLGGAFQGSYVALTGIDCSAATTPPTTPPTSTTTPPPSTTTNPPSTTTGPTQTATSTTNPPTSTPPTTPPPTTEPPTPTPTTTTLPVTG